MVNLAAINYEPIRPRFRIAFEDVVAAYQRELGKVRRLDGSPPDERDVTRAEWVAAVDVLDRLGVRLSAEIADRGEAWVYAVTQKTFVEACDAWGVAIQGPDGALAPGWAYIASGLAGARLSDEEICAAPHRR